MSAILKPHAQTVILDIKEIEGARPTFGHAFDALLTIQAPKAKNTFAQSRCVIEGHLRKWFEANCPYLDVFERNYEEIWAKYLADNAEQLTRKGKPRKFGHDRRYLVMTLKRAQNKGWISKSFTKRDFALNEVTDEIGRALSDDEVKRLLKALDVHPRTQLQVMISLTMGMRITEILKLRVDEVDLVNGEINLDAARVKTRRRRKAPIPISNEVKPELYARVREAKGIYVFPMYRNPDEAQSDNRHWWTMARRSAGVECRFHDLRHTWATNMISMGFPEDHITKVGGFTKQVMSRTYSHLNREAQNKFRGAFDGRWKNDRSRRDLLSGGVRQLGDLVRGALARVRDALTPVR